MTSLRFFVVRTLPLAFALVSALIAAAAPAPRILVFTKTAGYRHASIPHGITALEKLGASNQFVVDRTEDAAAFTEANLARYRAVVFLNTTGNVLDAEQQNAFERYIQAGGGYVGVHAAADTEYAWPWYAQLMGAHFESHPNLPNVRRATVRVTDPSHPASATLPAAWVRTDEWYNYRSFYPGLRVLAQLDEETYSGGTHGSHHPIAWYHDFDGGRAFYTGGGHTDESFREPEFLRHLLGGLRYAMGDGRALDFAKAHSRRLPDETRFEKTVLIDHLASPMELAIANDGRVFFTELGGKVSVYTPETNRTKTILEIPVSRAGGTGLMGIALDPDFDRNRHLYLYQSPPTEEDPIYFHLSRYTLNAEGLIPPESEKILLKVPVSRASGSHHGGSLAWDPAGNLYLSTGDSSPPHPAGGYAPLDERPGRRDHDAQRSAANTDDLKGKILRITPQPDGTYTIPAGNLFPPGTAQTRPEIFAMGVRNPFRLAINPRTSVLYWGEIGPDAGHDSSRGPRGYDEFNRAKQAGNFGWPYFHANNQAYARWDYDNASPGPRFDLAHPRNDSPNNTGLTELPLPQPALVWYPYAGSPEFPELGEGGRSAMVGAFYTHPTATASARALPAHFDGGLFVFDWMRNWVKVLRVDENDEFVRFEPFMSSNGDFRRPIDLAFNREGVMYLLEYGSIYGMDNEDARLVRIDYNAGNRAPLAQARFRDEAADRREDARTFLTSDRRRHRQVIREWAGAAPLTIRVSGHATDPDDNDALTYEWIFENGRVSAHTADAAHTFHQPGVYQVLLRVTDRAGEKAFDELTVTVGNTRPEIAIDTRGRNQSFYWDGETLPYAVTVSDADGGVDASQADIRFRYEAQPTSGVLPLGARLMAASDCRACHTADKTSLGPSWQAVAQRYREQADSVPKLADKIISGGGGNWGDHFIMSAHPQLPREDAEEMVRYVLSLGQAAAASQPEPPTGTLVLDRHQPDDFLGRYRLDVHYTDAGTESVPPLSARAELTLRNATIPAEYVDGYAGFNRWGAKLAWGRHKSHLSLRDIDLTGIREIAFTYTAPAAGEIEVRQHSLNGPVLSRASFVAAQADAVVTAVLAQPVTERGDLYFIMRQPQAPNENVITVKTIRFEK